LIFEISLQITSNVTRLSSCLAGNSILNCLIRERFTFELHLSVYIFHLLTPEVEVKLRLTISRPVRLGVRHPSGTRDQISFLLEIFFRQLRVCYFVAPSLTRGRVCNLLLLLVLVSLVPFGSESCRTQDHILLSNILILPLEDQIPVFHQEQGCTGLDAFRLLLRFAGLRWRYSIPPPHGRLTNPRSVSCLLRFYTDRTENTVLLMMLTGHCILTGVVCLFVSLSLPSNVSASHDTFRYILVAARGRNVMSS
jgi:hypothetical protein